MCVQCTYSPFITVEPQFNEVPRDCENWFIKSRVCYSGFIFHVLLSPKYSWLKNIACYTEDFVIQRFVKSRFHCISPSANYEDFSHCKNMITVSTPVKINVIISHVQISKMSYVL